MKNLVDYVLGVIGVVALAFAGYEFYQFVTFKNPVSGTIDMQGGTHYLWLAIVGAVIFAACALGIFLRHVNKEEEIHITGA
jgi:hypothetical protein